MCTSAFLIISLLSQETWALAGTTGSVSGVVTADANVPVAGASVVIVSASQRATATTDARGSFSFISLAPDTYTLTVSKSSYGDTSIPGIVVFADQNQALQVRLSQALRTIAHVTAQSQGSLVKSGTTTDVYAVNAATASQLATSGGANNINSAYSAIYAQPGVVGLPNNFGFGQVFYIHGSSYNQIGYEFDGVPVNRAFDNYNSSSLSNLGTQSTEVYTGGGPADATSPTLGGYINQIIKTGTYPGSGSADLGIGGPAFYHSLSVEAGGASPDRLFSYYVALRGDNMIPIQYDAQNGGDLNPDGNNKFGVQGYSLNTLLYPLYNFGFTGSQRGPWSDCNPDGSAPANGSYISPSFSPLYGVAGPLPSCNVYSSIPATNAIALRGNDLSDRESVVNFHLGIPHKHDSGRDDVQLLFDNFYYQTQGWDNLSTVGGLTFLNNALSPAGKNPNGTGYYNTFLNNFGLGLPATQYPGGYTSVCDFQNFLTLFGAPGCASSGPSPVPYFDGYQVSNATFGQSALGQPNVVSPYYFPSTNSNRPFQSGFAPNQVSDTNNNGSIIKLQYQHNIGENAYLRLYGYTFYSDWLQTDPNYSFIPFTVGAATAGDYELNTHSRGLSATFADQVNSKNLITASLNYTDATLTRWNNSQYGFQPQTTPIATLGSGGTCYAAYANAQTGGRLIDPAYSAGLAPGTPVSCLSALAGAPIAAVQAGACPPGSPAMTCLQTPAGLPAGATWSLTQNLGPDANVSHVAPKFTTIALQDDWQPSDRWNINGGVRLESYGYKLGDYSSAEQAFWFNQINSTACVDTNLQQAPASDLNPGVPRYSLAGNYVGFVTTAPGAPCPFDPTTNVQLYHPGQQGIPEISLGQTGTITRTTMSPRVGFTYTISPNSVIRLSYGRYTQPTNTAAEQVLTYADGYQLATNLYNSKYYNLGLSTVSHDNPIQFSNNIDASWEKRFNGTDVSFKLSPFYRYTTNQSVQVFLPGGLAGSFNSGTQRTSGVELAIQKGDVSRNGLSGQLSYTYTNAKLRYSLINGGNIVSTMLNALKPFLALEGVNGGSPCYVAGVGQACTPGKAGEIANPYYGDTITQAQVSSEFPVSGFYPTFANFFPYGLQSGDPATAIPPNDFAGFLSWKHDKLQVTATANLWQGYAYGSPVDVSGLDPRSCGANQADSGIVANSLNADYQTCTSNIAIPNPYTGQFAQIGQYRDPWDFNLGLQVGYDISKTVHASLQLANVLNRCFGGSAQPWTAAYAPNQFVCGYAYNTSFIGTQPGAGYFYGSSGHDPVNGTVGYPGVFDQAYAPTSNQIASPFQAYLQVQIKL